MWDDAGEVDHQLVEVVFIRASLVRAAALDAEMKTLIPKPPVESIICDMCDGTGIIRVPGLAGSNIVCQCGGFGWLDPIPSDSK